VIKINVLAKSALSIVAATAFVVMLIGSSQNNTDLVQVGYNIVGKVLGTVILVTMMINLPRFFQ
jgi:hypothetical protein